MIELLSVDAETRAAILARDHSICVMCGSSGPLVFHEVVPGCWPPPPCNGNKAQYESERLVTLCKPCAFKVETMTNSPYCNILEQSLWKDCDEKWRVCHDKNDWPLITLLTTGRRLAHKTRFGAEITSRPESISEHSYWVALFAKAIARHYVEPTGLKVNEGHVLDIALNHDIPEILTTDVPNPIKKASRAVERFYNRQERLATIELAKCLGFSDFSDLVQEFNEGKTIEAQIAKMADKLSGLIWCVEELACGNRNIVIAFRGYYNELVAQGNVEDIPDWRKKLISDVTGFVEHHFSLQILKGEIIGDK